MTTTVTLSGETGWDFTVAGTDIGKVTLLDASGVTGSGAIGAVKAIAQTSEDVTFKGGFGDDELTGGAGDDTLDGGELRQRLLDGGDGTDRAVFAGNWTDYTITVADGVYTVVGGDRNDTLSNSRSSASRTGQLHSGPPTASATSTATAPTTSSGTTPPRPGRPVGHGRRQRHLARHRDRRQRLGHRRDGRLQRRRYRRHPLVQQRHPQVGQFAMNDGDATWDPIATAGGGWAIAGAGDFNGDSTDDVLWYNAATGQVGQLVMNDGDATWDGIATGAAAGPSPARATSTATARMMSSGTTRPPARSASGP